MDSLSYTYIKFMMHYELNPRGKSKLDFVQILDQPVII